MVANLTEGLNGKNDQTHENTRYHFGDCSIKPILSGYFRVCE